MPPRMLLPLRPALRPFWCLQHKRFYGKGLGDPIVISGVSCRLPKAKSFTEFQENLFNGVDMCGSQSRFKSELLPPRHGALEDLSKFDASFFKISPQVADSMDPQVRMTLEVTFECLLDAGYNPAELNGKNVGVYAGALGGETSDYFTMTTSESDQSGVRVLGGAGHMIANNISYYYNFHGKSSHISCGCVSSMSALEFAYYDMKCGLIDAAVVTSTCIHLNPGHSIEFNQIGALSQEGFCRPFDERADGFVRSEAVVSILLQRKSDARRCRAIVRDARTNSDGFKEDGIARPSSESQFKLITKMYRENSIHPKDVGYFEAHGTGTPIGDVLELNTIASVFFRGTEARDSPLPIGSVKSNVGHTESSAAATSILKALSIFQRESIPATINHEKPNRSCAELLDGKIQVVKWNTPFHGGLVSISCAAIGGTNGHAILEPCTVDKVTQPRVPFPTLLLVSGRSREGLERVLTKSIDRAAASPGYATLVHKIFEGNIPNHDHRGYGFLADGEIKKVSVSRTGRGGPVVLHLPDFRVPVFSQVAGSFALLPPYSESLGRNRSYVTRLGVENLDIRVPDSANSQDGASIPISQWLREAEYAVAYVDVLKAVGLATEAKTVCEGAGSLLGSYVNNLITAEQVLQLASATALALGHGKDKPNTSSSGTSKETLANFFEYILQKGTGLAPEDFLQAFKSFNSTNYKASDSAMQLANSILQPSLLQKEQIPDDSFVLGMGMGDSVRGKHVDLLSSCTSGIQGFLQALGEAYAFGSQVNLEKLYPQSGLPLPPTAPETAALATWDRSKDWRTFVISYPKAQGIKVKVDLEDPAWSYLEGHRLCGSTVFPATGFVYLMWRTLADRMGLKLENLPVKLQDIRIHTVTVLDKDDPINLEIAMLNSQGMFEMRRDGEVVCSGKIFPLSDAEKEPVECEGNGSLVIEGNTFSREEYETEMKLRGYHFKKDFLSIVRTAADGFSADIEWTGNWVTYLDGMFQSYIFTLDTRETLMPILYPEMTINPAGFHEHLHKLRSQGHSIESGTVQIDRERNKLTAPGFTGDIPLCDVVALPRPTEDIVLEEEVFRPYFETQERPLDLVLLEFVDLINENSTQAVLKVLELLPPGVENGDIVKNALEGPQRIRFELETATVEKTATETDGPHVYSWDVVVDNNCDNGIKKACQVSRQFVIVLGSKIPESYSSDWVCVSKKATPGGEAALLKKKESVSPDAKHIVVKDDDDFSWIPEVQTAMADASKDSRIYLWADSSPKTGIVGLTRCLRMEPGGLVVRCIVPPASMKPPKLSDPILQQLISADLLFSVYHSNQWGSYRHMILNADLSADSVPSNMFLTVKNKGDLSSFLCVQAPDYPEDEHTYKVACASLNFRDVMMATGALPSGGSKELHLGFDFTGYDSKGSRVMGLYLRGGSLATQVQNPDLVWDIPDKWTLEEAATVPVAYSTAIYGLVQRARLKAGDSVLIHAGAGGVGQAAIATAISLGCKVFTTVGSEEKKKLLLDLFPSLDPAAIGSSRDGSFKDMVMKGTKGLGVTAVLNSLAGDLRLLSIACLGVNGRFIEIGANNLQEEQLGMGCFLSNTEYHGIFLNKLDRDGLDEIKQLVQRYIDNGVVQPIQHTVFQPEDLSWYMNEMAVGNHTGKLVMRIKDAEMAGLDKERRLYFSPDKAHVIVGGLGGIGIELAEWLVQRGARHLVFVSRSGNIRPYTSFRIKNWRKSGVSVDVVTKDLSCYSTAEQFVSNLCSQRGLGSIFNLALVLKDGLLKELTPEDFRAVIGPKALITQNLDVATRKLCPTLEHFSFFSSAASGFGNQSQTNYGYANASAERICEQRVKDGYPATALQIGLVTETGYVSRRAQAEGTDVADFGSLGPISIVGLMATLEKSLMSGRPICSVFGSRMHAADAVGDVSALKMRVLAIFGIQPSANIDDSATLRSLGLTSITATMIRQILLRQYKTVLGTGKLEELTLRDIVQLEETGKLGGQ